MPCKASARWVPSFFLVFIFWGKKMTGSIACKNLLRSKRAWVAFIHTVFTGLILSIMATIQSSNRSRASYKAQVQSQLNRIKLVNAAAQSKQFVIRELRSLIQLTQAHKAKCRCASPVPWPPGQGFPADKPCTRFPDWYPDWKSCKLCKTCILSIGPVKGEWSADWWVLKIDK